MFGTAKNLGAGWLATRGTRRSGTVGTLAKLGLASKMTRGRGFSGRVARAGIAARMLQMGLYGAVGVAAVAAGIWGVQKALGSKKSELSEGEPYYGGA
jgi:hypothetical protein